MLPTKEKIIDKFSTSLLSCFFPSWDQNFFRKRTIILSPQL